MAKIRLRVNVNKTKIIGLSSLEGKTMSMVTNPSKVYGEWINIPERCKIEKSKMVKEKAFNLDRNMFLGVHNCLDHDPC